MGARRRAPGAGDRSDATEDRGAVGCAIVLDALHCHQQRAETHTAVVAVVQIGGSLESSLKVGQTGIRKGNQRIAQHAELKLPGAEVAKRIAGRGESHDF